MCAVKVCECTRQLGDLKSFAIQFSSLEKLVENIDNLFAVLDIAITREH
jgi:hypothetical protein